MPQYKNHDQLKAVLKNMASKTSVLALSKKLGFSQAFLYKVITGERRISPKLAQKLGFRSLSGTFQKV